MVEENPLLYRFRLAETHRPPWKRALSWGLYPLLILACIPLSVFDRESWLLVLFVHMAYFCGRPLMRAVTTLATEKQHGTFECLQATGFSARQWLQSLFRYSVSRTCAELLLFSWVLALALSFLGNSQCKVNLISSLQALLYTLTCIPFYAAAGLWLSARNRQPAMAQLQGILVLTSTFFLSIAVDALVVSSLAGSMRPTFCLVVSPWMAQCNILGDTWHTFPLSWVVGALGQLILTVILLASTLDRLRRPETARGSRRDSRNLLKWAASATHSPALYRWLLGTSGRHLWLYVLGCPLLILVLRVVYPYSVRRGETSLILFGLLMQTLYLTVRAITAGSAALASERESRTWESLLSTRLSVTAILRGQWLTTLLPVLLECWLSCALWWLFPKSDVPRILGLTFYLTAWTVFVGSLALWQSSHHSTAIALRRSTAVVAALSIGGLFFLIFDNNWGQSLWACISPFLVLASLGGEGHFESLRLALCGGSIWLGASILLTALTRRALLRVALTPAGER